MDWMYLLGRNLTPADESVISLNRLVAVACMMRLTSPSAISDGRASEVVDRARKFEEWLKEASTEDDARIRRLTLLMVCDNAAPSTPPDRIRTFARDLHRYVTRNH